MIGWVEGKVIQVGEDGATVAAGGIGWEIRLAPAIAAPLRVGDSAAFWCVHVVREDLEELFGYPSREERDWHRLLVSVQGVGAKVAQGILGALGAEGAARAVALGDAAAMKAAPGVGPKLAQRLVLELKGKAPGPTGRLPAAALKAAPAGGSAAKADALSALGKLGYGPAEAAAAVAEAEAAGEAEATGLIRAALRALAPKR